MWWVKEGPECRGVANGDAAVREHATAALAVCRGICTAHLSCRLLGVPVLVWRRVRDPSAHFDLRCSSAPCFRGFCRAKRVFNVRTHAQVCPKASSDGSLGCARSHAACAVLGAVHALATEPGSEERLVQGIALSDAVGRPPQAAHRAVRSSCGQFSAPLGVRGPPAGPNIAPQPPARRAQSRAALDDYRWLLALRSASIYPVPCPCAAGL